MGLPEWYFGQTHPEFDPKQIIFLLFCLIKNNAYLVRCNIFKLIILIVYLISWSILYFYTLTHSRNITFFLLNFIYFWIIIDWFVFIC